MVLPIIAAGTGVVAGVGLLGLTRRNVKIAQEEAIELAIIEATEEIENEYRLALNKLKRYEKKARLEFYCLSAIIVFMVVVLINYPFLGGWIAVLVLFRSTDLLAQIITLYSNNPEMKKYLKLIFHYWINNKPRFRLSSPRNAVELAIINDLRDHINSDEVWDKINLRVDEEIGDLKTIDTIGYNIFGDRRKKIASRIQVEVLKVVECGKITSKVSLLVLGIISFLLIYTLMISLMRLVTMEIAGISLLDWHIALVALIFFLFWFFIHKRSFKSE